MNYFLALGSNLGDRLAHLLRAIEELTKIGKVLKVSTIYESEPWGVLNQPKFLNCVLEHKTHLEPKELLGKLKEIEVRLGRKKRRRWGEREIDIDILLCEDLIVEEEDLKIPHPYLTKRDFFYYPLLEIGGNLRVPGLGFLKDLRERPPNRLRPFCSVSLNLLIEGSSTKS